MLLLTLSIVLFVIIAFVVTWVELKRRKLSLKYRHIPGIKEYPIIGNIYTIRPNDITDIDILTTTCQVAPVSKVFITCKMYLLASDPQVVQEILTSKVCSDRPFLMKFFTFDYGLIPAEYHKWKPIRKALRHNFTIPAINSSIPTFITQFSKFCDELKSHIDGPTFDIYPLTVTTAMELTSQTLFGQSLDDECTAELCEHYLDSICQRIITFTLYPQITYKFSKLGQKITDICEKLIKFSDRIVEKRTAKLNYLKQNNNYEPTKQLFIDALIEHSKEYDDEEISKKIIDGNIVTFFMAGFDTTAQTISNALLLLAMHPEVDRIVAKELADNYKDEDEINQDLFKRLPYVECVIKETLRMFPVSPVTIRMNMEDINLSTVGHVQKGTSLVINLFRMHRWKHIWGEDAEEFKPDRFLPENSFGRHPGAFIPFAAGPRMCIGYQHAMTSFKTALVLILSRYRFSTTMKVEDISFKLSVTMKMLTKHLVKVHKRN